MMGLLGALVEELRQLIEGGIKLPDGTERKFILAQRSVMAGDVPVLVDVAKFDRAFVKDTDYIGSNDAGISGRREKFVSFLQSGRAIEMPEVSVTAPGRIVFVNGRHRYAALRDIGVKSLYIAFPKDQAEQARKEFGA